MTDLKLKLSNVLRKRLPFLFWPLMCFRDRVDTTEPDGGLREHVEHARYSLRLQRYWWAACKIEDEVHQADGRIVIVDLGCERGWLKRFTRPNLAIRWIGVDGDTSHPALAASKYDQLMTCNFHEPLPLPDDTADVVVSLHVFEHLHDPEFAASEVARVLKPGGVFLAGTPGSPAPIASVRTKFLEARERAGHNRHWGHVRKFSPASWSRVCTEAGLRLEFLTGSHLIRRTRFCLENQGWWVRLNQLWGGLFPSLGQEAYLAARKPEPGATAFTGASWLHRLWLRVDWAVPAATVLALAIFAASMFSSSQAHPLADDIARQQDGNDVFYWCPLSGPEAMAGRAGLDMLRSVELTDHAFTEYSAAGRDLHLIVHVKHVETYLRTPVGDRIRVASEWVEDNQRFLVLSLEDEDPLLTEYLSQVGT